MVTAGVYLVARCSPLFALAPDAQLVVATLGTITMLGAALIGLTQNDLKRVLAYSTLSQLGYMFLALGCALNDEALVLFAVGAAIFHLLTHAFFKALLFLSAGSVMHAMGNVIDNVIDMRRFSGLRKVLPHTHWTFLIGALTLAGVPGLSGFWSKDEILDAAYRAGHHPGSGGAYTLLFLAGMLTAFLTAFYTFRAYFMTFWGELKVPPEAGSHGAAGHEHAAAAHGRGHGQPPVSHPEHGVAHESPPVMTVPLMVLAVCSLVVGVAIGPTHWFAHLFETTSIFRGLNKSLSEGMNPTLMVISSLLALGGIGLAWLMYVRQPDLPGKFASSARALYQLSYNKFYVDEIYGALIVAPLQGFNQFARIFDLNVIDNIVDLIGHIPVLFGKLFRPVQNGLVQWYALFMALCLTVFLLALVYSLQG
jgi:NADH-quinone oxidoreductase subunit L